MCVWQALIHGLNRHYYSIAISYRKNELEERMLMNLQKKAWTHGLTLKCATPSCILCQLQLSTCVLSCAVLIVALHTLLHHPQLDTARTLFAKKKRWRSVVLTDFIYAQCPQRTRNRHTFP